MGASIETMHLTAAICEKLANDDQVLIKKNKVVEIRPGDALKRPIVVLEDGSEIEADLLVGSDGEKSQTRNAHNIGATGYHYVQSGLVCTVKGVQANPAAFQRFLTTGPVALLPLWGDYSSIVWSCPPGMARDL